MSKRKSIHWELMGREIGKATGWDQQDSFAMILYEFVPVEGFAISSGDIVFNFETGRIEKYDDDGKVAQSWDMITAMSTLPEKKNDTAVD